MTNKRIITIKDVEKEYDLELERVVLDIKKNKVKLVLLQFPDGLKQYSTAVADYLREQTKNVDFLIWFGDCFGSCDTPVGLEGLKPKVDLVIQFGHSSLMPSYLK